MNTNSAALKRDGERANNRPSLSDENFKRLLFTTIREMRTAIRRDGGSTYDVALWLRDFLKSHSVTSKLCAGTIVLPSGRLIVDHYWIKSGRIIIDPSIEQLRELGYDVGYFDPSVEVASRYFDQKHDSEEDERRSVRLRAKRLGFVT